MGALAGFGALLKVWPALLLAGAVRRRAWGAAAVTAVALAPCPPWPCPAPSPSWPPSGDRGTEVESVAGLVLHVARHFGWPGEVLLRYGSLEFAGPYVGLVSDVALGLTALACGWLLLWRLTRETLSRRTRSRTRPSRRCCCSRSPAG